jgi:hypothetical protein
MDALRSAIFPSENPDERWRGADPLLDRCDRKLARVMYGGQFDNVTAQLRFTTEHGLPRSCHKPLMQLTNQAVLSSMASAITARRFRRLSVSRSARDNSSH